MSPIAEKHKNTVGEAIEHLISRAENARGLTGADIAGRVEATLAKYLLNDATDLAPTDIEEFVHDIRADDLCLIVACERGDEKAWEDPKPGSGFNIGIRPFQHVAPGGSRRHHAHSQEADVGFS